MERLWRVVAPHFVAGMIEQQGVISHAAPILRWAVGRSRDELRPYFSRRGWTVEHVSALTPVHYPPGETEPATPDNNNPQDRGKNATC